MKRMKRSCGRYPVMQLFFVGTFGLAHALLISPLQGQVLTGRLLAAFEERPIPDGVVQFLTPDGTVVASAMSGEDGRFVLAAPEPGRYLVRGEAAFFEPVTEGPLELRASDTLEVELRLLARPVEIDPVEVEVEGRSAYLEREGFYGRARRRFGSFLTQEDIDRRPAIYTSDLLRELPGVRVQSGSLGPPMAYLRSRVSFQSSGTCEPIVYIDNVPYRSGAGVSPVNVVEPDQVAGIEVYNSQLRVPPAYAGASTGCGVILIWTRK